MSVMRLKMSHHVRLLPILGLPFALLLVGIFLASPLQGEVLRVEVESRELVLEGRAFGPAGAYEKLTGWMVFGFDPENPANRRIVDLALAPRNARGLVEARANFMVLQPVDPALRRGVAFVEVSNRGGKAGLSYFNRAQGSLDPHEEAHFGDGLLMRMGLTVIWVGWQWDIPAEGHRLRLETPVAQNADGSIIQGLVRSDWTVDETVRTLSLGHRGPASYRVADPASPQNVLTVRSGREAPRQTVPRDRWSFAREADAEAVMSDGGHLYMAEGFQEGMIYELVYVAENPVISGLGLAAVRDVMSYARHNPESLFPVKKGVAFGVSQTGRFLRHFLYDGFNTDEAGRQVYDGMLIHTAGAGRGSFNHRFAQPSRDAHRYSAFFYPTDIFPFTSQALLDPLTGRRDGLLTHAIREDHVPRIFQSNSGYEYWGRGAGLIHTTVDGSGDVAPFPGERIYHHSSGQHFLGAFPPPDGSRMGEGPAYRGNPVDFLLTLRALMVRMVEWVDGGQEPPPSRYPRAADGTLVHPLETGFPAIPGVETPTVIHQAYRANYGPRWEEGIVDNQPPELGPIFPARVSPVDEVGNEVAGVRTVEVRVPLATYTPWNLRWGFRGSPEELTDFLGSYIPLPVTEADRSRAGDPRPSVESLYESRDDYLAQAREAARTLVSQGFLLEEDVVRVMDRSRAHWDWLHTR
ncbi:MAG: alpha/beta hydrolase domain-containing protein [Gemmatimonadota bacterium]